MTPEPGRLLPIAVERHLQTIMMAIVIGGGAYFFMAVQDLKVQVATQIVKIEALERALSAAGKDRYTAADASKDLGEINRSIARVEAALEALRAEGAGRSTGLRELERRVLRLELELEGPRK